MHSADSQPSLVPHIDGQPELLHWETLLGLPAATAAGLLLRVLLIGSKSLWLDEAMSLHVTLSGAHAWLTGAAEGYHPPLYYAFLSGWIHIGRSVAVLRLSSALFGVLSIPVTYLLARFLAGKGVARTAAWLVALSPLLVWYSQEFRSYSLLVFLALVSSLAFAQLVARARVGWWLLYVASTAAALYTHYDAVLVVPLQVAVLLALLAQDRVTRSGLVAEVVAWPVILAAFWPWLASPAATSFADFARATGGYPGMLLTQTLGFDWPLATALLVAASVVLAAAALGTWVLVWKRGLWPRLYRAPWLRGVVLAAFVVLLIVSVVPRGYSIKRLTVISVPFVCLAVAWFWPMAGRLSRILTALLVLSALAALVNVVAIPKDDWRGAFQHLSAAYQPGDAVWIAPGYDNLPFDFYNRGQIPVTQIDDAQEALDRLQAAGRIWLVYNDAPTRLMTIGPQIEAVLASTHRPAQTWSAYRIRVVLFEPK